MDKGCESPGEKYEDLRKTSFIKDLLEKSVGISFSELLGFGIQDSCATLPFLTSCDFRVSLGKTL